MRCGGGRNREEPRNARCCFSPELLLSVRVVAFGGGALAGEVSYKVYGHENWPDKALEKSIDNAKKAMDFYQARIDAMEGELAKRLADIPTAAGVEVDAVGSQFDEGDCGFRIIIE